jgi:glycosyltransferase involved in cell wall biosynthesis
VKILHVIDSAGVYGAEVMLLNLMMEQQTMGYVPVLVSLEMDGGSGMSEGGLPDEARKRQVDVIRYPTGLGYSWSVAKGLFSLAKTQGAAIIHSHGYKGNILLGSVPRRLRTVPIISTIHGWTVVRRLSRLWWYVVLDKFFLGRMDATVSVSPAACVRSRTAESFVVPNGMALLKFPDRRVLADSEPEIMRFCSDAFVVGVISRLSDEKGLEYLINAVEELVLSGRNLKAVIFGEGPQRESLQRRLDSGRLTDRILLVGYKSYAHRYLPLFDTFVLPSLTEGLPMTLLEAMQAGVPIIASRVGGIPGLLKGGALGLLVEPGDTKGIRTAIDQLYADREQGASMVAAAREEAVSNYSSRCMAERYASVYTRVIQKWTR